MTTAGTEFTVIQLTDDEALGVVNQARVDDAIAYADQLIDGYLRGRYTLPLSPAPGLVKTLSVELALFHLYSRKMDLGMPDPVIARYKNAVRLLEHIQKGLVSLGIEEVSTPEAGMYKGTKRAADRVFGKECLKGF